MKLRKRKKDKVSPTAFVFTTTLNFCKDLFFIGEFRSELNHQVKGEKKMYFGRHKSFNVLLKAIVGVAILTFFIAHIQPAFAEGLLTKIKQEKKLVVGTEAALEPMEFVKDGKIIGYGKDFLDIIAADLDVELVQYDLPFQGIIPGLLAKKFDLVATSVAPNEERIKKVAFTLPIAAVNYDIVVLAKNKDIKSQYDLNGKVVATQLASAPQPVLEKFNNELKAKGGSGYKQLALYQAFPETYIALANGQVDAICIATISFAALNKKRPGVYKVIGSIGDSVWLCWLTRPQDIDVRDYINSMILKLRDSGKLYELQRKWLGTIQKIPDGGHLPPGAF
jgi:polar amino acid transport system substrate-binding protein